MSRYKLTLEYDGGPFCGWQRQANGPSVQAALEDAILAFCGEKVQVVGAGRTDAGVHATGQVAHVDLERHVHVEVLRDALNHHLRPTQVAVLEASPASSDFHARFSATTRHYLYRIINRRAPLTLDLGRAWLVSPALDVEAMHEAARCLIGHHDFSSFRGALCQARSPIKTLDHLAVFRQGDLVVVEARARSFLHHQVRNMVGTLKLIGDGRWPIAQTAAALAARERRAAGPTAPACGLYLTRVDY